MIIVITGCNDENGIGQTIAKLLAHSGHIVYATMRGIDGKNKESAAKLRSFAEHEKLKLYVTEMDVSSEESVQNAIKSILEKNQRIDVVINNAAKPYPVDVIEAITVEEAKSIFEVNIFGSVRVCNAVIPCMRNQRQGLLIQVSSLAVQTPTPLMLPYAASKAAVETLAQGYRMELAQFGIDSVVVQLGYFPGTKAHDELSPGTHHQVFATQYSAEWNNFREQFTQSQELRRDLMASKKGQYYDPKIVSEKIEQIIAIPFGQRPFRFIIEPDRKFVELRQQHNQSHSDLQQKVNEAYGLNSLFEQKAKTSVVQAIIQQRVREGLHVPSINQWDDLIMFKPPVEKLKEWTQDFNLPRQVQEDSDKKEFDTAIRRLVSSSYWPLHCIEEGYGSLSIDFFSVNIKEMPILPESQQRCTAEELLQYIRLNFNDFIDPKKAMFELYHHKDTEKWRTPDYLGTLIHIDFAPRRPVKSPKGIDKLLDLRHATVVVSEVKNTSWTFSTLWSPNYLCHPISGNRRFGAEKGSDGGVVFYTKAADRVTGLVRTVLGEVDTEIFFTSAQKLWESLQQGVCQFVNQHSGSALIPANKISERRNWEKGLQQKARL